MIHNQTYEIFAERVKRRLENDWNSDEFTVTDNEIYLYMQDGIATVMTALAKQAYAVEGIYGAPDGFKTTFKFTQFTKDWDNGLYSVLLPHPPLNLPLGYSIENPHFASSGAMSYPLMAVHGYNAGYYDRMEKPPGMFYKVQGAKMLIDTQGFDLINAGMSLYVTMMSPRGESGSASDTINLPGEALGMVFDYVVERLAARVGMPKDKVNDGSDKKTEAA